MDEETAARSEARVNVLFEAKGYEYEFESRSFPGESRLTVLAHKMFVVN